MSADFSPDEVLDNVNAFFRLPVAPEYLTNEALMACWYRAVGFSSLRDKWVMLNSKALSTCLKNDVVINAQAFTRNEIQKMLKDILLSPEEPSKKQSSKYPDYFFFAPIVPSTAYFSNPVRLSSNLNNRRASAWNVECLLMMLVAYVSLNKKDATDLWDKLFAGLGVDTEGDEDYFAKIVENLLQACAAAVKGVDPSTSERFPVWEKTENIFFESGKIPILESNRLLFSEIGPLDEIRHGILDVLSQKHKFSRWQWLTMFDALMRMSMISFVLWLFDMYHVALQMINEYIVKGVDIPEINALDLFKRCYQEFHVKKTLCYGEGVAAAEKDAIVRYAKEHLSIAFFLERVKEVNQEIYQKIDWSSVEGFVTSLRLIRPLFNSKEKQQTLQQDIAELLDLKARECSLSGARPKHMRELFAVLRQKVVIDRHSDFIRYDQSYLVRKRGNYSSAPFIVDMGSVTCFTVIFCCANGRRIFPLKDLYSYLDKYYISVRDSQRSRFVDYLKGLDLTMDSPDADDGLMVRNPFYEEER